MPTRGGSGSSLPAAIVRGIGEGRDLREWVTYWTALTLAVLVLGLAYGTLATRGDVALAAIRDSEVASASLGVRIWRTKLLVYVAVGGATAVIGGIGTIEGPIVGTIVFFALRETLADLGSLYLMILGLVAIVVMLKAPQGIWGYDRRRFAIELFPLHRRVRYQPSPTVLTINKD